MKNKIVGFLAMLTAVVILTAGCASTTPTQQANIEASVKLAAYVGTFETLKTHPEWRSYFVTAGQELNSMSVSTNALDMAQILAIVNQLPVKELKNDQTALIVTSATILLQQFGTPAVPADKVAQLKPIAGAIGAGIELGLAQRP